MVEPPICTRRSLVPLRSSWCRWWPLLPSDMSSKAGGGVEQHEGAVPSNTWFQWIMKFCLCVFSVFVSVSEWECVAREDCNESMHCYESRRVNTEHMMGSTKLCRMWRVLLECLLKAMKSVMMMKTETLLLSKLHEFTVQTERIEIFFIEIANGIVIGYV